MRNSCWQTIARVNPKEQTHQNQKPIDLLKQAIEKSSDEGAIVFDGFMGSGSTGVACMETNRNFIGIELDEICFDIAKQRIEQSKQDAWKADWIVRQITSIHKLSVDFLCIGVL